ncbi:MAG: class I SAM-dependent methyltransferase [Actinobacteria bacterium]|nr:class I SAM-dependent methyltransferase [Actinomycetota bacterium]
MASHESRSVVFDRASDYYDRTRSLPEAAQRSVTELLAGELRGRSTTLEIGVGTGRIALPLNSAGIPMTGVDLSAPMLARLVAKAGGHAPFPIAIADATALPLADDSAGGAVACHVLHLISPWREAAVELARVVRPGGVILIDLGGWAASDWGAIQERFRNEIGAERPGAKDVSEVDEAMTALGLAVRRLTPIEFTTSFNPETQISDLARGLYSIAWDTPAPERERAAAAVRIWAEGELGDLGADRELPHRIDWRAYDLPAARPSGW